MRDQNSFSQNEGDKPLIIFSIGHSNQSIESFLMLLQQHEIQALVDVRSKPYSKYVPHFNGHALATAIEKNNIRYLFMGEELGGRPDGDEFYDDENHVLYDRVAESPFFLKGLKRLKNGARSYKVAIMCSEEDPGVCHRHLLIGRILTQQGVNLFHIRGNGHAQPEQELASYEKQLAYKQSLWNEPALDQEESPWRSIRPVLRRKQQLNSLDL